MCQYIFAWKHVLLSKKSVLLKHNESTIVNDIWIIFLYNNFYEIKDVIGIKINLWNSLSYFN